MKGIRRYILFFFIGAFTTGMFTWFLPLDLPVALITELQPGSIKEKAQLFDINVAKEDWVAPRAWLVNTRKGEVDMFTVGPYGMMVGVSTGSNMGKGGGYFVATYEIVTDVSDPGQSFVERIIKRPPEQLLFLSKKFAIVHWRIHIDEKNLQEYLIKEQGLKKMKKTILNSLF